MCFEMLNVVPLFTVDSFKIWMNKGFLSVINRKENCIIDTK